MFVYYTIVFFVLGCVLGSFYNVLGYRLPCKESIIFPSSHCPNCNHKLTKIELIPIISFLIQGGRCKKCRERISIIYPIIEFITGVLFSVSFIVYGMSLDLCLALIIISSFIVIMISDVRYMIIPDSVLIVSTILIIIIKYLIGGFDLVINGIIYGLISFGLMWMLKIIGDKVFKKESLGGGDIKLMFLIGFVLAPWMGIIALFIASFLALPVAIIILITKNNRMIPFGPFLCLATLILYLFNINFDIVYQIMIK